MTVCKSQLVWRSWYFLSVIISLSLSLFAPELPQQTQSTATPAENKLNHNVYNATPTVGQHNCSLVAHTQSIIWPLPINMIRAEIIYRHLIHIRVPFRSYLIDNYIPNRFHTRRAIYKSKLQRNGSFCSWFLVFVFNSELNFIRILTWCFLIVWQSFVPLFYCKRVKRLRHAQR